MELGERELFQLHILAERAVKENIEKMKGKLFVLFLLRIITRYSLAG